MQIIQAALQVSSTCKKFLPVQIRVSKDIYGDCRNNISKTQTRNTIPKDGGAATVVIMITMNNNKILLVLPLLLICTFRKFSTHLSTCSGSTEYWVQAWQRTTIRLVMSKNVKGHV